MTRAQKQDDLKECISLLTARARYLESVGDTEGVLRASSAVKKFADQLAELTDLKSSVR